MTGGPPDEVFFVSAEFAFGRNRMPPRSRHLRRDSLTPLTDCLSTCSYKLGWGLSAALLLPSYLPPPIASTRPPLLCAIACSLSPREREGRQESASACAWDVGGHATRDRPKGCSHFLAVVTSRCGITQRRGLGTSASKFFVSIPPMTSQLPPPRVAGLGVAFRARNRGLAGPAMTVVAAVVRIAPLVYGGGRKPVHR
jgi:hypothetical protein